MVYLDTNVLIYAAIEQDIRKKEISIELIRLLSSSGRLILSPLVLQEYIFTLSKFGVDGSIIDHDVSFYQDYMVDNYDQDMLLGAMRSCTSTGTCKNINDWLHIKIAQKHSQKLITFDSDFKKFQKYTDIEIEIL